MVNCGLVRLCLVSLHGFMCIKSMVNLDDSAPCFNILLKGINSAFISFTLLHLYDG
jgi:hypothetical protein